jgi:hypothetical protein
MTTYSSSKTPTARLVTGLFRTGDDAERAYQKLLELGYNRNEITIVMTEETRQQYTAEAHTAAPEVSPKTEERARIGGGIGAAVGALFGALAAIGTSLALPGLGLLVAGPLVVGLAGAGAGGLTGTLIGALVGSGISEEQAAAYEQGIREGGILLSVLPHTETEAKQIVDTLENKRGELITR